MLLLSLLACQPKVVEGYLGATLGESCVDDSCANGLVCAQDGACAEEGTVGTSVEGDECSDTLECAYGLVCSGDLVCVPAGADGTAAPGDACAEDRDCEAGAFCDGGVCVDAGIPWWEGGACPPDEDDAAFFYAYFDVPDLPVSGAIDFYTLPFPNDARIGTNGRVDLSGHPTPGATAPAVDALIEAIEAEATGFGLNPTVYFRFNRAQDPSSLTALTEGATVRWVSLDEDAPDRGELGALSFRTSTARGRYICQNWLAVSVYDGQPLQPGHTYAVWLTRGVRDAGGAELTRDDGFKVMMGDTRPEGLGLSRAWDAYAPLRDFVVREGVDADEIVAAAVFTTADPGLGVRSFRELAREAGVVENAAVRCDSGVDSPCSDGGARECVAAAAGFDEVHGRLRMPGYRSASGDVVYEPAGFRPEAQGEEQVCYALTLPAGEAPDAGWPVAVYLPDAGRTFRAAVEDGVAAAFAERGFATLTLELPAHGERGEGPDGAVASYLVGDLPALRGNLLQSIADPHAAEAWLGTRAWTAEESPTGRAVAFDPDHVWFVGEGAGASAGMGALAWSQGAEGGVLGNPEGRLIHKLADQDEPVPLARELKAAFADAGLSPWHPILALAQLHLEPADAVNHARGVVRDAALDARHLLVIDGVEDAEVPRPLVRAAITAASIPVAGAVLDDYGQASVAYPVSENVATDDGRRTAVSVQAAGDRGALHELLLAPAADLCASALEGAPVLAE